MFFISVLFLAMWYDGYYSYGSDPPNYILLARSMFEGKGYVDLFDPKHPPHTKFPPLFPLMLASMMPICGDGFGCLRLGVILWAVGAMFCFALLIRQIGHTHLIFSAVLATVIPFSYWWLQEIASEWPYAALTFLTFFYLIRCDDLISTRRAVMIGFLAGMAILCRTIGIVLVAAIPLAIFVRFPNRQGLIRSVILFGAALFLPLLWSIRNDLVSSESQGYVSQWFMVDPYTPELGEVTLNDLWARAKETTLYYSHRIPELLF